VSAARANNAATPGGAAPDALLVLNRSLPIDGVLTWTGFAASAMVRFTSLLRGHAPPPPAAATLAQISERIEEERVIMGISAEDLEMELGSCAVRPPPCLPPPSLLSSRSCAATVRCFVYPSSPPTIYDK